MLFDVFICHASEDKDEFVRPLAHCLLEQNLAVWYDEFSMSVGDSLRRSIDKGLAKSRFGIVVLSPDFLRKGWAQRELDGLIARQVSGGDRIILPVWHHISADEIMEYSMPLADTLAVNSSSGVEGVCRELIQVIKPDLSPLIIARDELIQRNVQPPLISDEWWLDIAQMAESYNIGMHKYSWTFPLPGSFGRGEQRGKNLAWTAMQWDWSHFAEQNKINHVTRPEVVIDFINDFPGLHDMCFEHPEYLACYAPQLTIPGMAGDFENLFDDKLRNSKAGEKKGTHKTTDRMPPLCEKEWALRHPDFGNFQPWEVADFVMSGRMGRYNPQSISDLEYLIWLLSDESEWLPEVQKDFLIKGVSKRAFSNLSGYTRLHQDGPFPEELYRVRNSKKNKEFKLTKKIVADLKQIIAYTLGDLEFTTSPEIAFNRMIERDVLGSYLQYENWLKEFRRGM